MQPEWLCPATYGNTIMKHMVQEPVTVLHPCRVLPHRLMRSRAVMHSVRVAAKTNKDTHSHNNTYNDHTNPRNQ